MTPYPNQFFRPGSRRYYLSMNLLPPVAEGMSVPWIELWQFVHRSTSGKLAPLWCAEWHCRQSAVWLTVSMFWFGDPCAEWHFMQSSFTGGCWNENGPWNSA